MGPYVALTQQFADAYLGGLNVFARTRTGKWYIKHIAPHVDPPLLRLQGAGRGVAHPAVDLRLPPPGEEAGRVFRNQVPEVDHGAILPAIKR